MWCTSAHTMFMYCRICKLDFSIPFFPRDSHTFYRFIDSLFPSTHSSLSSLSQNFNFYLSLSLHHRGKIRAPRFSAAGNPPPTPSESEKAQGTWMARIVCGIPFRTKRGTTTAREVRRLLVLACIAASLWAVHSYLYLSYLSVVPFAYVIAVAFALVTCCAGAQKRNPKLVYAFHVGTACAAATLAVAFTAVFVVFIALGATQYIVQGSGDWSLNLTSVQKNQPCTDRLPLNNSHHTGPPGIVRPTNPIPLGCDFYFNMRGQQVTVFLVASAGIVPLLHALRAGFGCLK